MQIARVRFPKDFVKYIDEVKYQFGWVSQFEVEEEVEMNFATMNLELVARWLLMSGRNFKVVSPETLKERISGLIKELQTAHLKKN
jgi:predicted DNA-binding transcriptional regulator YafY